VAVATGGGGRVISKFIADASILFPTKGAGLPVVRAEYNRALCSRWQVSDRI
jgi:hypothetical protein